MVNFYPEQNYFRLDYSLDACLQSGDRILTAPQFAQARIENSELFLQWTRVLSLRLGCKVDGKPTALYWHPKINNPDDLRGLVSELKSWYAQGLTDTGALKVPRARYLDLLAQAKSQESNSRSLWYISDKALHLSQSNSFCLNLVLWTTEIVPFLGSVDLAQRYIAKSLEIGRNSIGVLQIKSDSYSEDPQGRVLIFGNNYVYIDLITNDGYDDNWRFAGVPFSAADTEKISPPEENSFLAELLSKRE